MRIVTSILHFYPKKWRERYQDEMLAVLEQHAISLITIFDLLFGALDARLDPSYRSEEGFMFSRLRDTHALATVFIGAIAIFLFSLYIWMDLSDSLSFQDNPLGSNAGTIASTSAISIIPELSIIALLVIAVVTVKNVFNSRQFGALIIAAICVGLGVARVIPELPPFVGSDGPVMNSISDWLSIAVSALGLSIALFVIGIKGLKAIQERQWWSPGFTLAIAFLLPACLIIYGFWSIPLDPGSHLSYPPGGFVVGSVIYPSIRSFVLSLLPVGEPFLYLGALLLALTSQKPRVRSWQITRGFGLVFAFALAVTLLAVVVWDINRWLGGNVFIFRPVSGVLPFFGSLWLGALITNALILLIALGIALLALIRSFMLRPSNELPADRMAA